MKKDIFTKPKKSAWQEIKEEIRKGRISREIEELLKKETEEIKRGKK